jgi:hypothetical protein
MQIDEPAEYLVKFVPKSKRSLYAQFRGGVLPLQLEIGRFKNILDTVTNKFRKLKPEERICEVCSDNTTEDEMHFLLDCKAYDIPRNIFIQKVKLLTENYDLLSKEDKFIQVLKKHSQECIKFVVDAWNIRRRLLYK